MSLNKTLDRLFDEIRREAKRNPDFADRLDAVMRAHASRRDVADEVVADVSSPATWPQGGQDSQKGRIASDPAGGGDPSDPRERGSDSLKAKIGQADFGAIGGGKTFPPSSRASLAPLPPQAGEETSATPPPFPPFNPVGVFQRDGEDTLKALLGVLDLPALKALIAEHHLDPVGAGEGMERDALVELVLAQVKKRVERDKKLFDY